MVLYVPIIALSVKWDSFLHFPSFQICRSKVTIKVTQVKSSGMNRNASSQGTYLLLNMKAQSSNGSKVKANF